jgi:hypothetical protein
VDFADFNSVGGHLVSQVGSTPIRSRQYRKHDLEENFFPLKSNYRMGFCKPCDGIDNGIPD